MEGESVDGVHCVDPLGVLSRTPSLSASRSPRPTPPSPAGKGLGGGCGAHSRGLCPPRVLHSASVPTTPENGSHFSILGVDVEVWYSNIDAKSADFTLNIAYTVCRVDCERVDGVHGVHPFRVLLPSDNRVWVYKGLMVVKQACELRVCGAGLEAPWCRVRGAGLEVPPTPHPASVRHARPFRGGISKVNF